MASVHSSNNHLPQDLVTAILVRLPPKSLVRFRSVDSSWNTLFRSRTFVTNHHSHHSSQHECLMIFHTNRHNDNPVVVDILHSDDPSHPPHHVPLPLAMEDHDEHKKLRNMMPYGSCNGIFFLFGVYRDGTCRLMLWNPGTREVKVVPPPHHLPSRDMFCHDWYTLYYLTFGFGVDPKTNDYNVVSLFLRDADISAEVYSLSTDSWTIIHGDVPRVTFAEVSQYNSTHANGVCHWFCGAQTDSEHSGILCFDLSNDQFKLIKLPIINNYKGPSHYLGLDTRTSSIRDLRSLAREMGRGYVDKWRGCYECSFLVNDSIAYVARYRDCHSQENESYRFGVWVFNEAYGDEEGSWIRTHDIEPFDLEHEVSGFWKATGEFLATTPHEAYLVSPDNDWQLVRRIIRDNMPSVVLRNYVESIAPLSF